MVELWDEWECCHLQAWFWRQGAHLDANRKFCRAKPKGVLASRSWVLTWQHRQDPAEELNQRLFLCEELLGFVSALPLPSAWDLDFPSHAPDSSVAVSGSSVAPVCGWLQNGRCSLMPEVED